MAGKEKKAHLSIKELLTAPDKRIMLAFTLEGLLLQFSSSIKGFGNNLFATNLGVTNTQLGLMQTVGCIVTLLMLIPCILITGPAQAGMAYVMRNWARDEHAFPWADFKDAVKDNWKQALGISALTAVLPYMIYIGYNFYGQMQQEQGLLFMVPQMLMVIIGVMWCLALVYFYPLMVSYKMTFGQLLKNGFVMAIARLPMNVGIRLATLIPTIIALAVMLLSNSWLYALLGLALYYVIFGNAMTRFIFASYTNGVFDKYINSRIEGVEINRGLAKEDDDDYDDEDEEEETSSVNLPH